MSLLGNRVLRTEDPEVPDRRRYLRRRPPTRGRRHVVVTCGRRWPTPRSPSIDVTGARGDAGRAGGRDRRRHRAPPEVAGAVRRRCNRAVPAPAARHRSRAVRRRGDRRGRRRDARSRPSTRAEVIVDYDPLPVVVDAEAARCRRGRAVRRGRHQRRASRCPTSMTRRLLDDCEVVVEPRSSTSASPSAPMEPRGVRRASGSDGRLIVLRQLPGRAPGPRPVSQQVYGLPPEQVRVITPDVGGGFGAKASPLPRGDRCVAELARRSAGRCAGPRPAPRTWSAWSTAAARSRTSSIGGSRDGTITAYAARRPPGRRRLPAHRRRCCPVRDPHDVTGTYGITNVGFTRDVGRHQHHADRRVPRRRPPRGHRRDRAGRRHVRGRDRHGSGRGAPRATCSPDVRSPHTTATGTTLRQRATTATRSTCVLEAAGLRRAPGRAGAPPRARRPRAARHRRRRPTSRSPRWPARRHQRVRLRRAAADGTRRSPRPAPRRTAGPRHDVGDARSATSSASRWTASRSSTATPTSIPRSQVTGGSRSVQIGGLGDGRRVANGSSSWRATTRGRPARGQRRRRRARHDERRVPRRRHAGARRRRGPRSRAAPAATPLAGESRTFAQPAASSRSARTSRSSRSTPRPARSRSSATSPSTTAARVVNPLLCEGQVHGGLAQGAAQALLEEIRYDEDGNPLTRNFADYGIISAAELPELRAHRDGDAARRSTRSARRASASPARSARRPPCRARWSTRSRPSASATSTCPAPPRRSARAQRRCHAGLTSASSRSGKRRAPSGRSSLARTRTGPARDERGAVSPWARGSSRPKASRRDRCDRGTPRRWVGGASHQPARSLTRVHSSVQVRRMIRHCEAPSTVRRSIWST